MVEANFREIAIRDGMLVAYPVETSGLTWMAIHGAICLALRHPKFNGPSRAMVLQFVLTLGQRLVEHGVLTKEELALVERTENLAS